MLYLTIISIAIAVGLGLFAHSKVPSWKERDFGSNDFKWDRLIIFSSAISIILAHVAFFLSDNIWTSLTVGIAGFGLWLLSATDYILMKIPHEITTVIPWIPVPMMIIFWPSFDYYDILSISMWAVFVFLFGVMSFFRFFGWADVKIMFAFLTLFSWWIGPTYMVYGFLLAAIIGLLSIPVLRLIGIGQLKKTIKESHTYNQDTKKMESVTNLNEKDFEGLDRKKVRKKIGKKKLYVAFGPPLLISYVIMALISSATSNAHLYTWWGQ